MTDTARTRELRQALTEDLAREYRPSTPVLNAIGRVPRHVFIPDTDPVLAYTDDVVITRRDKTGRSISSISQPSMIAQMLELLDTQPGQRILEIGAGTGYCAALLAELVGPAGTVTTIDLEPEITDEAHRNLDATGYGRVRVTCADGALGEPSGAPWDRIIVSTGAWEPAPEWIAQLTPDGKLVMPLAVNGIQRIVSFSRTAFGLRSAQVLCGGFLAQRGRDAGPRTVLAVTDEVAIESEREIDIDATAIRELLTLEPATAWSGVELPYMGRYDRLLVYLALHHPSLFTMTAPRAFLPDALRAWNTVYGVVDGRGLAHLMLRTTDPADPKGPHEIGVRVYGPDATGLADRLSAEVRGWGEAPHADPIFEVYPKPQPVEDAPQRAMVLDKRHSRIRVIWPDPTEPGPAGSLPAVHEMRLLEEFMELLEQGKKTIEIRCADSKRRTVRSGDDIVFNCGDRSVRSKVIRVSRYSTFEELYAHEDAAAINPGRGTAEQLVGLEQLYEPDKRALGAVAIEVRLLRDVEFSA